MAIALDTLKLARRFKDAGVPEAQAEVFVDALREARESAIANLATKADLELLGAALKTDLELLGAALKTDLELLRVTLKTDVEAVRREAKADLEKAVAELRGEIARSKNSMLMWLLPILLGQLGAMLFLLLKMP
jgi:DNA-binding transcriptional MerR regulator